MMNLNSLFQRKTSLFTIVLTGVILLLAIPIIIPHILHGYHLIHIGIHVSGIILSVFLTILAVLAYKNLRSTRMLLTLASFSIFVLAEIVTLIDATWPGMYYIGYSTLSEIGHLLLIVTLGLLSIGAFKND